MKRSSSDAGLNDPNEKRSKSPLTIYEGAPGVSGLTVGNPNSGAIPKI